MTVAALLDRWTRLWARARRGFGSRGARAALEVRSRIARSSLVGPDGPVVSMTTYGARASTVHVTVESIGRGSVRPSRLVLWVDDPRLHADPPPGVRRAMARGLELRLTDNLGPHTKYYPYVASAPELDRPLVTADDDIMYPRHWLAALVEAHRATPDEVCAFRAHLVLVDGARLAPYASWPPCRQSTASPRAFATGVSGVLYPVAMQQALRERGDAFLEVTRRNDDVWLHWVALRAGIGVRQIGPVPRHFAVVPRSQAGGLLQENLAGAANDGFLAALYEADDVERIAAAPVDAVGS